MANITAKKLGKDHYATYVDGYELSNYSRQSDASKEVVFLQNKQWHEILEYVRHKYPYTLDRLADTPIHHLEKYLAGKAATSLLTPSDHYDPYE